MKTVYHQQIAVKIHDKYALSLWSVSAHLYVILDILCELDDKSIKKTMGGVCSVYFVRHQDSSSVLRLIYYAVNNQILYNFLR